MAEKQYIGDGVYVEFENGMLKLTTERAKGWETIYLEPAVWTALVNYVARLGVTEAAKQP